MAAESDRGSESLQVHCLHELPLPVFLLQSSTWAVRECNRAALQWLGGPLETRLPAAQWATLVPILESGAAREQGPRLWTRLEEGRPSSHLVSVRRLPEGVLMTVQPLPSGMAAGEPAHLERTVREVHHRLKNSLQGVAGLLARHAHEQPAARHALEQAVRQIRVLAEVQDLQLRQMPRVRIADLFHAVLAVVALELNVHVRPPCGEPAAPGPGGVGSSMGPDGDLDPDERSLRRVLWAHLEPDSAGEGSRPTSWFLAEAEAASVALCAAELLADASARGGGGRVDCTWREDTQGVGLDLECAGTLPEGFSLAHQPPGSQGLGLALALLPRRGARLTVQQQGPKVCARLHIGPPCAVPFDAIAAQSAG